MVLIDVDSPTSIVYRDHVDNGQYEPWEDVRQQVTKEEEEEIVCGFDDEPIVDPILAPAVAIGEPPGTFFCSQRCWKITCLSVSFLLFVTVLTIIGVFGIDKGTATDNNNSNNSSTTQLRNNTTTLSNDSPSEFGASVDVPSSAPAPTLAKPSSQFSSTAFPTKQDPCPDQLTGMRSCFASQGTSASSLTSSLSASVAQSVCESCLVESWPDTIDDCSIIRNDTCAALQDCECGNCGNSVASYLECISGCTLICDANSNNASSSSLEPITTSSSSSSIEPTIEPVPTASPAPTPAFKCPDQDEAFNNCVDPINGNGDPCLLCLLTFWPSSGTTTTRPACLSIVDATCLGFDACTSDCNNNNNNNVTCQNEYIDLVTCLSGCPTFECD